jgi:hypothetical protein
MGIEPMTFRLQSECSTTKLKEQTRETLFPNFYTPKLYPPNLKLNYLYNNTQLSLSPFFK